MARGRAHELAQDRRLDDPELGGRVRFQETLSTRTLRGTRTR
jgi:hypothetical protein